MMAKLLSWLFALSRPHRKEEEEKVTHALTHNVCHSFLHRLPLDILFYLTTHYVSDPVDLLALRATTRALRFSPIIHPPPTFHQTSRDFLKRLRRDHFTRACDAENEKRQRQQTVPPPSRWATIRKPLHLCSGCQDQHPSSHFSSIQLARAPESRRCKGTNGAVRVCPHLAFTFAELRQIEEQGRTAPWTILLGFTFDRKCSECPQRGFNSPEADIKGLPSGLYQKNGLQRQFYILRRWLAVESPVVGDDGETDSLVVLNRRKYFTPQFVLRVLKAMAERDHDIFVCHHVRLNDPETFETEIFNRSDCYTLISEHKCRAKPPCHVYVRLMWFSYSYSHPRVVLEVERYLNVVSPNDERWLCQVQEWEEK